MDTIPYAIGYILLFLAFGCACLVGCILAIPHDDTEIKRMARYHREYHR